MDTPIVRLISYPYEGVPLTLGANVTVGHMVMPHRHTASALFD